jgi:ribosome-associated toxin RatA of RatAB toxin-antitoxin module
LRWHYHGKRVRWNVKTIQATVKVQTSPGVLWEAITDHQALPRHVSMLREVKVVGAKEGGLGTVRQCTLSGGTSFHEKVTAWEEGRRYCYQPDTDEAPFPFRWAEACWSIEGNAEHSRLTYRLQYEPRSRLRDLINYPLLRTYGVWQIKKMLKTYDQS